MAHLLCSLIFSLCCLYLLSATANSFEVTNTMSPVRTRNGCTVVLTCGGYGTGAEWRNFGSLEALDTTDTQNTTTRNFMVNSNTTYWVAIATIIVSPSVNNERFQCFVSTGEQLTSHQVLLRVEPEVVSIEPIREEYNISTYKLGSVLTIGCPVQTCAEQVTYRFLKEDTVIGEPIIRVFEETASVVNLVLPITDSVTGEYACKVDTVNPVGSATSRFEVVGTPLPAPTKDPGNTDPGSNDGDSNNDGDPPSKNDKDAAVTTKLSLSLAVLLLTVNLLL